MNAHTLIKIAGILLFAAVLLAAPAAAFTPVTITDATGTDVIITEQPERIISLTPAAAEILFAVGAGDSVIASSDSTNYPEEAAALQTVGSYVSLNKERIITLEPDLLIGEQSMTSPDEIDYLRRHGCKILIVASDDIESTITSIATIGKATGHEDDAQNLINNMQKTLDLIAEKTASIPAGEKPKIAHLLWYNPLYVSGKNTMQNDIITTAGGINAFGDVDGWGVVTIEKFLTTNPDIIILNTAMDTGESEEEVINLYFESDPRLKTVSAYKNNAIYVIDGDLTDRSGPRFIQAVEAIAKAAYPDIFGEYTFENTQSAKTPGFAPLMVIIGITAAVALRRRI